MLKKLPRSCFGCLIPLILLILSFVVLALWDHWRQHKEVAFSDWKKEGEWIVFACHNPYPSIYIVRPDGSEATRVTTDRLNAAEPRWSPDGEEIVFALISDDYYPIVPLVEKHLEQYNEMGIYKLSRGHDRISKLIEEQGLLYSPAWSPDRQWIVYGRMAAAESGLFRMKPDGSENMKLFDRYSTPFSWTPDSQWVSFGPVSNSLCIPTSDPFERPQFCSVKFDGSEVKPIETKYVSAGYPVWSPDGQLMVVSDGGIYLPDSNGNYIELTGKWGRVSSAAWSPDGQWIVFSSLATDLSGQLFKIRTDGSDLQQITHLDCNTTSPDWIKMPENDRG